LGKPKSVAVATLLLWIGFVIDTALGFVMLSALSQLLAVSFSTVLILAGPLAYAFLIYMISTGRNWARVVYLVIFILSTVSGGPGYVGMLFSFHIFGIAKWLPLLLEGYAFVLLFSVPSNAWFRVHDYPQHLLSQPANSRWNGRAASAVTHQRPWRQARRSPRR